MAAWCPIWRNVWQGGNVRELLSGGILVAPGIYDGLGAALAERAGFRALYLSGASIAYTRFGRPDIGLVSMSEVADTLGLIRERCQLPVIVDADTGFGNALNVQRTVARFERDGAAAIQLEDQTLPKRCGHLAGKTLVPAAEMVGKIKAATDARRHDTLIVARTDAIAVEGLEPALERAERYAEAGADVLFVEAPRDETEMASVCERFRGRVPLLANMVEGGSTPMHTAAELEAMGFAIVIFPSGLVRAQAKLTTEYFASLSEHGWNQPLKDRMLDFQGLNDLLGTADILAAGQVYDAANFETDDDD
ncbi:MAG: carboxyvinyl-carboxyphosphonate phosphorylmutase [Rhodospirillaceae bacterium]|nr:carboxyvinyl-carboxyphosphonate phosphorylmutase [Rhodospirillaceae bacterium]